jgi:hypothetical protein
MPMLSASADDDCRRYPAIARDDTVPSHALERIAALPLTRISGVVQSTLVFRGQAEAEKPQSRLAFVFGLLAVR